MKLIYNILHYEYIIVIIITYVFIVFWLHVELLAELNMWPTYNIW